MREPVLVASVDGVGTKLKIAFAMDKHDTVGVDLVNHCVGDIAVLGARPLFFLDYIGCERLEPRVFQQLLRGFSRACRTAGCALLGGETAQMPGMYRKGEYDLAGCIVGVVDRTKIIDGSKIKPGDILLGLASNGLHTNGYSLARKVLFDKMRLKPRSPLPGSTITVGEELLRVHKNYQPLLAKAPVGVIKGLAHITGGGLIDMDTIAKLATAAGDSLYLGIDLVWKAFTLGSATDLWGSIPYTEIRTSPTPALDSQLVLYDTVQAMLSTAIRKLTPVTEVGRDEFTDAEMRADVRQLLIGCTPRQRAALVLVDLLGYPSEQAARILGVRPSTVRVLASQGRKTIRGTEGARDA